LLNIKADAHFGALADRFDNTQEQIVELLALSRSESKLRHKEYEETMAAIVRLSNGSIQKIVSGPRVEHLGSLDGTGDMQTATSFHLPDVEPIWSNRYSSTNRNNNFGSNVTRIVDSLFFHQISDRYEEIAKAHQQTFEWAFCDPTRFQRPWSHLVKWLKEGNGRYWICGKAGSGKSLSTTLSIAIRTWLPKYGVGRMGSCGSDEEDVESKRVRNSVNNGLSLGILGRE